MMEKLIELEQYRDEVYLELCLDMISDAHHYAQQGMHDLVQEQLKDILETFDRADDKPESVEYQEGPMNHKVVVLN